MIATLIKESLEIPNGFHEEVYYNKETNELTFSSPLTNNNWTNDPDKIGTIESLDINDLEGFYQINDEFVEIDDNCNETDINFSIEDYERFYSNSSIESYNDVMDRIIEIADIDQWYSEILEQVNGA